jgi:tetratricopeptide (TPR) repeat protein
MRTKSTNYFIMNTVNPETEKTLEQAWKKFNKKDFDSADELFATIAEEDSSFKEALYGRSACQLRKKDFNQAIEHLDRLQELDPEDYKTYHVRALCYGGDEDYEMALKDLQKAIDIAGDRHDLYYDMGGTLLAAKEYKRAAQYFEKCIDIDNKCYEAWVGKALAAYFNKEMKAAFEFANIALKFNPKSIMALLLKTEVLMETGKKDDAGKEVKKILALDAEIFKARQAETEETEGEDYDMDEDAYRTEDDEIEEFDLDD